MNKPIKIILLIVAIILAIGGVLFYMKTIVSPPQDLKFKNQYVQKLTEETETLRKCDQPTLEHDFLRLTDLSHRFKSESLIDDKTFDSHYSEIIGVYSPKFAQYCFGQFQKSVWDANDLKWMEGRISQLRNLTVEDGSRRIMDSYSETDGKFSIIIKTIGKYREASALANRTRYSGLADARAKIQQANQFKQDDYLRNNASLMKALNSLPDRLEASHYASLSAQVRNLASYYNYSADSYDSMSDNVVAALKEYKQNARSVYGESRSLDGLEAEASRYYNQAVEYFNNN